MGVTPANNNNKNNKNKKKCIGILAFESASNMSRLVSLHNSLSDNSLRLLRSDTMRSPGISYLTSSDQHFLLRLLYSDVISLLDFSASSLSRLSQPFSLTYSQLKSQPSSTRSFSSKPITRTIKRMEKNIASVSQLLRETELLQNMLKTTSKPPFSDHELRSQRRKIARIKEESLWGKTSDHVVSLMSRVIIAVFARVCVVFGPFVPDLPPVIFSGGRFSFIPLNLRCRIYPRINGRRHASGPMERSSALKIKEEVAIRNSCPIILGSRGRRETEQKKIGETVGMSGMATRYADVILKAESFFRMREEAGVREEIYRLLPVNLAGKVKGKLRERWRERGGGDGELAKGWKEAVETILNWLTPVARDTVTWQEEKTLDRRRRLDTKQRVFAMQTLHFSDKEKTEAAIVEVLVGISCMCWYDAIARTSTL